VFLVFLTVFSSQRADHFGECEGDLFCVPEVHHVMVVDVLGKGSLKPQDASKKTVLTTPQTTSSATTKKERAEKVATKADCTDAGGDVCDIDGGGSSEEGEKEE
jgi:hypothetical protein